MFTHTASSAAPAGAATVFGVRFFLGVRGRSGGCLYLVGVFGGVRVCSDLFRVVRVCSGCAGAVEGLTVVRGVNLCHGLVAGGVGCASVLLWGEGHGSALLFWYELSRSWGKLGVRGWSGCWRALVVGRGLPPPS